MPIRIEFELNAADFQELAKHSATTAWHGKLVKLSLVLTVFSLLVVGLTMVAFRDRVSSPFEWNFNTAVMLLFACLGLGSYRWSKRRFARAMAGKPWSCTFDPTTMRWSSPEGEGAIEFGAFQSWSETPSLFLLAGQGRATNLQPKLLNINY